MVEDEKLLTNESSVGLMLYVTIDGVGVGVGRFVGVGVGTLVGVGVAVGIVVGVGVGGIVGVGVGGIVGVGVTVGVRVGTGQLAPSPVGVQAVLLVTIILSTPTPPSRSVSLRVWLPDARFMVMVLAVFPS